MGKSLDSSAVFAAVDTFCRAANILDALPDRQSDDVPLREVLPGIWPTVGDLRQLRDVMKAYGWKPR